MILDDSVSAVDSVTEKHIIDTIREGTIGQNNHMDCPPNKRT